MPTSSTDPVVAAGNAIQGQMPSLLSTIVARFRRELPPLGARGLDELSDPVLADHTITWIGEIATELIDHAAPREALDRLISDGRRIYVLIAELHGRQRARRQWTEQAISHEYAVLREELMHVLPAVDGDKRAPEAVDTIDRIVSESCRFAVETFRESGQRTA
jgi:hypothetical protein